MECQFLFFIKGKSDIFWAIKDSSYKEIEKKEEKKLLCNQSVITLRDMARLTRLSHTLNRLREGGGGGGIRVMPPVQAWISLKNETKK